MKQALEYRENYSKRRRLKSSAVTTPSLLCLAFPFPRFFDRIVKISVSAGFVIFDIMRIVDVGQENLRLNCP